MSLLVMSNTSTSIRDRLSPGWVSRSFSRKKSPDPGPTTSIDQLSPPVSHRTSKSISSRRSSKSGSRTIRGMVNRLRSASNVSIPRDQNEELDFKEVDDWFTGYQRYNQLVTQKTSPDQAYASPEFSKAIKQLTKNCGGNFIHGLPEALFDYSLLWCPADASTTRNDNHPSWSWTSHAGPVNFPFDPTSCPDTYTTPRSTGETFRSEIQNFHIGPTSTPYTVRRDKHSATRIRYPPYFHAPRGTDPTLESSTLRFTTQTLPAHGFTASQLHYQGSEIPCSQLLSPSQQHCGVLMARESSVSAPHYHGPYEFVLMSRNKRVEPAEHTRKPRQSTMHPPGTPIWHGQRFVWDEEVVDFDDEVFQAGEWSMLNVLLIRWNEDHGRAERVAVGRIHEEAWNALGPIKRDIVLG